VARWKASEFCGKKQCAGRLRFIVKKQLLTGVSSVNNYLLPLARAINYNYRLARAKEGVPE
jgi:hypothetical protein